MLFRKTIYGSTISPACEYCLHGRKGTDPRMILCAKKGVVPLEYHCRKYEYDPLLRLPKRQPKLPSFTAEDFSLE